MINLLPPERKKQILAGQSNLLLLRYNFVSILLSVLLLVMVGGMYALLGNIKKNAEETTQDRLAKSAEYSKVKQETDQFKANLSIAKHILSKEVRYSKISIEIAQIIPHGIVLQSLQLDSSLFGSPIELNALGKSHEDAIRLKSALENSPIFTNVSLMQTSKVDGEELYPISIRINATIRKEALEK